MDEILNWLKGNWIDIAAYLGIGGASGFAGKKITDRSQDKKIEKLTEDVAKANERIRVVENNMNELAQGLKENAIRDNSNYEKQDERYKDLKSTLVEIKAQQTELMNKLFNLVQK